MIFFKKLLPKSWQLSLDARKILCKMKECEKRKIITGRQQFLIRFNDGKLRVVDSSYRKIFNYTLKKSKRMKREQLSYQKLCEMAIYKTKI